MCIICIPDWACVTHVAAIGKTTIAAARADPKSPFNEIAMTVLHGKSTELLL